MYMVFSPIHLYQSGLEFLADAGKQIAKRIRGAAVEDHATIFCQEDQMQMQMKDTVSTLPDFVALCHGPNYNVAAIMLRLEAYRFELRPNGEQERKMRRFAGSRGMCGTGRWPSRMRSARKPVRKQSGYAALCQELTRWRNDPETEWLRASPVHTTQQALRDLEASWSRHFESLTKRKRGEIKPEEVIQPPKFKKKHKSRDSFRYPHPKQFEVEQGNNRGEKSKSFRTVIAGFCGC